MSLTNFGLPFIQLWQLEALLLQRDNYMNYSRPLSTPSVSYSQNLNTLRPKSVVCQIHSKLKCLVLENWQRGWILLLWVGAMTALFALKFINYKEKAAFQVMGYCLTTAKGAAETLKLNMALILLPVCRNMLTWLRSTRARLFIPFDDNINFHKVWRMTCWVLLYAYSVMIVARINMHCRIVLYKLTMCIARFYCTSSQCTYARGCLYLILIMPIFR